VTLVFDFDGTIADSFPIARDIAYQWLKQQGLEKVPVQAARNMGVKGLIAHYHIPRHRLPQLYLYGRAEITRRMSQVKPIPGIPAVVKKLHSHHRLGIITSNSSANVASFLMNHHLESYFDFIDDSLDLFGKHHKLKRYAPDWYIGDETRDIDAARKAGCKSAAVTWGFESSQLLSSAHPDILLTTPSQLLTLPG